MRLLTAMLARWPFLFFVFLFLFSPLSWAVNQCTPFFSEAVQTWLPQADVTGDNGSLIMTHRSNISGSDSDSFRFSNIPSTSTHSRSCANGACTANGQNVDLLTYPTFLTSSSNTTINANSNTTIGSGAHSGNEFKEINGHSGDVIRFVASSTPYRVKSMKLEGIAKLYLPPGNYFFENLIIENNTSIETDGSAGTVAIWVKEALIIGNSTEIKPTLASRIAILGWDNITVENNSKVVGLVYSKKTIEVKNHAKIEGAVVALKLKMENNTEIAWKDDMEDVDLGDACNVTPPPSDLHQCDAIFNGAVHALTSETLAIPIFSPTVDYIRTQSDPDETFNSNQDYYYISGGISANSSSFNLNSTASTVRKLFASTFTTSGSSGSINLNPRQAGETSDKPERLLISSNGSLVIDANTVVNGFIYSKGSIQINAGAVINGAVAAEGNIANYGTVNYMPNAIARTDFNGMCENTSVITTTIEITSGVNALTCDAHSVTIQVLANGVPDTTYSGLITLNTSSSKGDWTLVSGAGNLNNGSGDDGVATYQFTPNDLGSVVLSLNHKYGGDVRINASDSTASDTQTVTYRPSGLKATYTASSPHIANRPLGMTLTAVGMNSSNSGCDVIKEYTGTKTIKFWTDYITPLAPSGNKSLEVNNGAVGKSESNATSVNIEFSKGVSIANALSIRYPDAGKIEVSLKDDTGIGAPPGDGGNELEGGGTLLFNPYSLVISNIVQTGSSNTNPATQNSGSGFIRAANPSNANELASSDSFDVTVKALLDCVTDPSRHCSGSEPVAESFQNTLTFEHSQTFPSPLIVPAPATGQLKLAAQSGMTHTMTGSGSELVSKFTYSEAGTLSLSVRSNGYLENGNNIALSSAVDIGRFYPAYLAWDNYLAGSSCSDFTYLDQQALAISYRLRAFNQAGEITQNYDNDRLGYVTAGAASSASEFTYAAFDNSQTDQSARLLNNDENRVWVNGVYELSAPTSPITNPLDARLVAFTKTDSATPDGPFLDSDGTQMMFALRVIGIDGEKLQDTSGASPQACVANTHPATDMCSLGSMKDLLYGRLEAGSEFGSESTSVNVALDVQYYDGSQFVTNERDNCTSLNYDVSESNPVKQHSFLHGDPMAVTPEQNTPIPVGSKTSELTMSSAQAVKGRMQLNYSAPEDRGQFHYFIDLNDSSSSLCWLRSDRNGDGGITNVCGQGVTSYCANDSSRPDDCVQGTVTFGGYRGNDRVVYRGEPYSIIR
ncbi:hypothetical protein MHO82_09950 [Vibrio sp. Of7-15]|uniref:DUF6701 domain-containing protein n=1 Tax=Vibrio sp. Of7-15 TaxID=2724879 RepID=UPI001EF309B5|nr:DUF6701 domain-containing protein [Vibrio sp. Of7-15]MCG7497190.1 hypothetical protein [Vibrio sp. Of7-15]